MFGLGSDFGRRRRGMRLWHLTRRGTHVICTLRKASDDAFVLAVKIDGSEIAARRYRTRVAAVGDAGFLLDRLATTGWTLVVGIPNTTLN
jgi:hypothetical protein